MKSLLIKAALLILLLTVSSSSAFAGAEGKFFAVIQEQTAVQGEICLQQE